MREPVFTGVCSAIVTPFLDSGGVHYDRFGQLIDQQIARSVDAICVCGTTGESATCPSGSTSPSWNTASGGSTAG